jgi:multiple sugar transport system permease protein
MKSNIISIRKNHKIFKKAAFYFFISPWLIGFLGLNLFPMLYSFYASFTTWDGITEPKINGGKNYAEIFTMDNRFWISLKNTFVYVFTSVPLTLFLALILAIMLCKKIRGANFFRSLFYLPALVSGVSTFITWRWMYDQQIGIVNYILSLFGIEGPGWLTDPNWAMASLVIMCMFFCGSAMIIFMAGLQNIPEQYYEAAKIDGASGLMQFFHITLPLLTPVLFFNIIMSLIDAFKIFTQPWVMTQGGPADATYVFGIHIYNSAFKYCTFGYASALAWILFIIIIIISFITLLLFRNRVYYEGR